MYYIYNYVGCSLCGAGGVGGVYYIYIYNYVGCSLCGAGGGGFMMIVCKSPESKPKLREVINSNKVSISMEIYGLCRP